MSRSDKNLQLDRRPEAEVVCWLTAAREQWRLWGPVDRLTAAHRGEERQTIWGQLSDSSRALSSGRIPAGRCRTTPKRFRER